MKLATRLILIVVLIALFSVSVTAYFSYRAASSRLPHALAEAGLVRAMQLRAGPGHQRMLIELRSANVQAALIALGVAVLAGSLLAYRFTRPILELTEVTGRYGRGERHLRAVRHGHDEVANLAEVFNRTADQLHREQELKHRFMADIAHELRTPLSILKSELEAIQDGLMKADTETVAQLSQQVDLLSRLVQDLRLLTLAEGGELSLSRVSTDLGALAETVADAFSARASAKGVDLERDVDSIQASVDPDRVKQVLFNLLDNALRHTPKGGWVRLHATSAGTDAVITVADNGPGIPDQELPHVFERFYRLDSARNRDSGGSGLGLAIARAIIELHGGAILAASRAEGGAVFEVRLPLAGGERDT